jgi:hypothetical protein
VLSCELEVDPRWRRVGRVLEIVMAIASSKRVSCVVDCYGDSSSRKVATTRIVEQMLGMKSTEVWRTAV